MTNVSKMFSVLALAALLFVGVGASTVSAKTVCNSDVPPKCEEVKKKGGRSPMFFFKELGITIAPEVAREVWRHPELREQVIYLWRIKTFGQ